MPKEKAVAKKARKKATKKKPMGRPKKYTAAQAQKIIDRYFSEIEKSGRPRP